MDGGTMRRLSVDHQAGRSGRDAVLCDESGRRVLGLVGDWAVTDDEGRTVLFLAPDYRGIVTGALVGGMIDGLLGGDVGSSPRSRNAGPGVETVKRPRQPLRGIPPRWTPVATVSRQPGLPGATTSYRVEPHEPIPPVGFLQRFDANGLAGYDNGYADRREGVFDLVHADGRPILRHWATVDAGLRLRTSTFDVEDAAFPLAEAIMLCLARWRAWRF